MDVKTLVPISSCGWLNLNFQMSEDLVYGMENRWYSFDIFCILCDFGLLGLRIEAKVSYHPYNIENQPSWVCCQFISNDLE